MMINGTIYISNDISNIETGRDGVSVISLCESPMPGGVMSATCLLPPPTAKMAEIDGDAERFYSIYNEYLLSDVPVDFISVLLGYLYRGGHIIFYTQADMGEPWLVQLCNHFMNYYGISIGTFMMPFSYSPAFDDSINDILFSAEITSVYEYLANRTPGWPIPPWTIDRIKIMLGYDAPQSDIEAICAILKSNPKSTMAVSFRSEVVERCCC